MGWRVWDTGSATAEENMAMDRGLMSSLEPNGVIHFYDWQVESATYGHFIDPYLYLNKEAIKQRNMQVAKRPTGGGILLHGLDLTFSVWIPVSHPFFSVNTLQNYQRINQVISEAISRFSNGALHPSLLCVESSDSASHLRHFCMAKPTLYDVMIDRCKVSGGAQRRTKHGFLHQGSIALCLPSQEKLEGLFLPATSPVNAMCSNSFGLLGADCTPQQLQEAKSYLKKLIIEVLNEY